MPINHTNTDTKASALTILTFLFTLALANGQGFMGHEITLYAKFHDQDGSYRFGPPLLIGNARVGSGTEFGGLTQETEDGTATLSVLPINIDAFSIEMERKKDGRAISGNFNGLVFEDTNGTLPPFASVILDEESSTVTDTRILVSPNSIWLNREGLLTPKEDAFERLIVTFAEPSEAEGQTLHRSPSGDFLLDTPTQLGARYRLEQSEDLRTFTQVYEPFTAITAFRTDFLKPASPQMHYRLRMLEEPSIPLQADFEFGAEGWTSESDSPETQWELGKPNSATLTNAASGTQAWGTNLSTDFGPDAVAVLRSPLVDLREHDHEAALTFRYVMDSPEGEGGQLRFVDENGQVLYRHDEPISGQTSNWTPYRLVLPEFLQNTKFKIEFRFLSDDDDEVGAGWFIDDVMVL